MAVNIPGVIGMVVFYLLVLAVGIWASFKSKKMERKRNAGKMEMALLGNRSINKVVGIFTMTATWIGGGFFLAISEMVYNPSTGLVGALLLPLSMTLAFIIGGLFFAEPMRDGKYLTMLDPFQIKYGKVPATVLCLASLVNNILWVTTVFIGLGTTMVVILDIPYSACIWISAAVAILYTLLGGLYSVAYTDIIQLGLMFVSLCVCFPFVLASPTSSDITQTFHNNSQGPWSGSLDVHSVWSWIDTLCMLSLGSLGFQEFHQRTLSACSVSTAKVSCFVAALLVVAFTIPPVLIGATAASTDWNLTAYGSPSPLERGASNFILPICLQTLTPPFISVIGIGAIAAAAMSSCDSSLLAAASVFSSNIYHKILRPQASQRELQWVIRSTVLIIGVFGALLSTVQQSIMHIWSVCTMMVYIMIFPQLICVLFINVSNGYGAVVGWTVGAVTRLLLGEPLLRLPAVIRFDGCNPEDGDCVQHVPINTCCMLITLVVTVVSSYFISSLIKKGRIPYRWDTLLIKSQGPSTTDKEGGGEELRLKEMNSRDVTEPMMS